jgi:hypothetical protein
MFEGPSQYCYSCVALLDRYSTARVGCHARLVKHIAKEIDHAFKVTRACVISPATCAVKAYRFSKSDITIARFVPLHRRVAIEVAQVAEASTWSPKCQCSLRIFHRVRGADVRPHIAVFLLNGSATRRVTLRRSGFARRWR